MTKKELRIVPAVTTLEALELCLQEGISVFCIENPLYSQMYQDLAEARFPDYRLEVFEEKQVAMLTKIKGKNTFDKNRYEPYYLPFQWRNWHS